MNVEIFKVGDIVTFSFASGVQGVIVKIDQDKAIVSIPKMPTLNAEMIRLRDLRFVSRTFDGNDILKDML